MRHFPLLRTVTADHGTTLVEMLVAMVSAIVVILALFKILEFSTGEESRLSERVQADRIGRLAMSRVVDELHSSCTGFGSGSIQGPSATPSAPLASTGTLDLWFISAYGSATSGNAVISTVYEHDIHWTSTGASNTGEPLGTLTDYAFESVKGSGPGTASGAWEFPALTTANAKARVLATNVIPATVSGTKTIFQYYALPSATGEFALIAANIATEAKANKIVKVTITFKQAPESANTQLDRVVSYNDAVVLRFNPAETGETSKDEPCT